MSSHNVFKISRNVTFWRRSIKCTLILINFMFVYATYMESRNDWRAAAAVARRVMVRG